jgi:Putative zinc-finger
MMKDLSRLGAGALAQNGPHDEFLEFCVASTTGELTDDEQKRLGEHLATCASCREALRQYESIVNDVIPAIAAGDEAEYLQADSAWSQEQEEQAEKALFDRLGDEEDRPPAESGKRNGSSIFPHRILPFSSESTWRNVWLLYAAGILLFCALCFFAYRVGMRPGTGIAETPQPQVNKQEPFPASHPSLEEQLSDAGHGRAVVNTEIAQRDKMIADLRRQLARQSVKISEMRAAQNQLESNLREGDASRQDLSQQKIELAQKLESAQSTSSSLRGTLDVLQQSAQDAARAKSSEAKVNDLTRQLQEQQTALEQPDELLAHDRDIREVMGARDLYIAEIYDVGGTGETRKPYGRVFYTQRKSLIFYAYDLDQQTALKRASTFQAWGLRGPDRQQAINLGVFYEDNATKKRWILKCDDPKTLAQIDAVFVTVEPNGDNHKPSGKSLLFAYLRVDPNHP